MGWLEIILLAVGATILAVNQLLKDVPALTLRLPSLRPRGWWNYVPFGFLVLAGLVYLARLALPAAIGISTGASEDHAEIKGLPMPRIIGFFEDRTLSEVHGLVEPYRGSPVEVSGPVYDVPSPDYVQMRRGESPVTIVGLSFLSSSHRFLGRLRVGDQVVARCVFEGQIDQIGISFEQCRLMSHRPRG